MATATLQNYDAVRGTIERKVCAMRGNKKFLADKVWKKVGVFGVYYLYLADADDPDSMAPVTTELAKAWGVTADQLDADAVAAR